MTAQTQTMPVGVQILGNVTPEYAQILTPEAMTFVADLHRTFNPTRLTLLAARVERQKQFDAGILPTWLPETESIRRGEWQVAPTPDDLQKRWVEITGPVERKMMINALNSGADVFMADFEDANSPTWTNCIDGQINLMDAVRHDMTFTDEAKGKSYALKETIATLLVRPRGWHLVEKHVLVDGAPISASLFDFGLYVFHNMAERLSRGTAPYFYLPKLESHLEARLWNNAFVRAQDKLGAPQGSIKATVLVETVLGALEMEEILYELRAHSAGFNAGRWDYIFSCIKKFRTHSEQVLPDRAQVTMTVPFMKAYTELMVRTCHKRGAHAIGGMAAFIPSRRDVEVNKNAFAKVTADKVRESADGCDGTWVAHPDLVPLVHDIFEEQMQGKINQRDVMRADVDGQFTDADITNIGVPGGTITEAGLRLNIDVGLQYINSWLLGNGAAAIYNLMEDAATAEISRSQIWQWIHNGAKLDDGRTVTRALYEQFRDEELAKNGGPATGRFADAVEIMDKLVLTDEFPEFLTLIAYDYLD